MLTANLSISCYVKFCCPFLYQFEYTSFLHHLFLAIVYKYDVNLVKIAPSPGYCHYVHSSRDMLVNRQSGRTFTQQWLIAFPVYNCHCRVKTERLVEVTGSHCHYQYLGISALRAIRNVTTTTTTVLQPLYRSTCISRHLQLRTEEFGLLQSFTAGMPLLTARASKLNNKKISWGISVNCYNSCVEKYNCCWLRTDVYWLAFSRTTWVIDSDVNKATIV